MSPSKARANELERTPIIQVACNKGQTWKENTVEFA